MRAIQYLLPVFCAVASVVSGSPSEADDRIGDVDRLELQDAGGPDLRPLLERATALKAERLAGAPSAKAKAPGVGKIVGVDCTKGQSIQSVVDSNDGPLVVEIQGICFENVRIERKAVTLRGSDPTTDGIRGVVEDPQPLAVVEIYYADRAAIEKLSIDEGPQLGVGMWFSHVTMEGCRVAGNGTSGVHVSSNSALSAVELTISENGGRGLHVQRSSTAFCTGCTLEDNAGFAAGAATGGLLSLLDSVVSGIAGIFASDESYADIDCVSLVTPYPCSLTATRRAAGSTVGGTAALYGAGDFSGQLLAGDWGNLLVYGARQLSTGVSPGGAPLKNLVFGFSTLNAQPSVDELGVAHESRLAGETRVSGFSRALLLSETELDGTLACDSAGDAWADGGVVLTPGSSVDGCEHTPPPP